MRKEIFINESMEETRIAIQEDSQLVEVYIERQDNHRMVGNVYKGKVENVLPGMQAAFVDIGYELNSFLPFSEIETEEYLQGHKKNKKAKSSVQLDFEVLFVRWKKTNKQKNQNFQKKSEAVSSQSD